MKKAFEKYDLIKLVGIFLIIAVLLTWLCSISYFSNGEIQYEAMARMGLFDLMAPTSTILEELGSALLTPVIFILLVCGFYKFLGGRKFYNDTVEAIATSVPKKVMVAGSTLVFALLSGVISNHYALILFVPFVISILSKMKVDKVSGIASTFGGILIGILGSTYSTDIVGRLETVKLSYGYDITNVSILFAIAYILLTYFTFSRMAKVECNKDVALLSDPFIKEDVSSKKKERKSNIIPFTIVFGILFILVVLGFIDWKTSFGIETFNNFHDKLVGSKVFGFPLFASIMGESSVPLGNWSLYSLSIVLMLSTLVLAFLYRVSFDKILEDFGDGAKIGLKPAFIFLLIYNVGLFTALAPTLPAYVAKLLSISTNFATLFGGAALTSLFAVDFTYTTNILSSAYALYESNIVAGLSLQSAHGITGLIAPTSAILMIGLAMYEVKFKDWFKHIWLYAISMIVISFIIMAIIMYL